MTNQIKAAGGVVFRNSGKDSEVDVLLIFRNKLWDLPKGKLEKGESIEMCAVREVAEETGTQLPVLVGDLGTTYHEYMEKGEEFGKTTYWYSMVFPRPQSLTPQLEEGIELIEWVPLSEAIGKVGFQNLADVLLRFKKFYEIEKSVFL